MNSRNRSPREALAKAASKAVATTQPAGPAVPPSAQPPDPVPEGKLRVRVRGPQVGRRRIGRHFTAEPQDIDVTADELELLRADPELAIRQIE